MAIKFVQQKQKQKYLIVIFIVIVLITAAVWWFGFYREMPSIPETKIILKEVKIDFDILESQEMKNFQPFREIPPFKGGTGRDNPFVPYK